MEHLFKRLLLRGAPSSVTAKVGLLRDVKFRKVGQQKELQLKGEIIPC